jgi:hypothetical protein
MKGKLQKKELRCNFLYLVPNDLIAVQNWQKMIFTQRRKEALRSKK